MNDFTGEKLAACYQCGKCSAGCPAAYAMDLLPHQVIRLIQLGRKDKVLDSHTIWMCASCETCTARCPKDVDLARVMDALRQIAYEEGRTAAESDTVTFQKAFLDWVRRTGRQFESGLVGEYKLRTGHLFQDLDAAPRMMGKLKMVPRRIKGQAAVERIFKKCEKRSAQGDRPADRKGH
ncbi:MAG: 4Fe-4S dicluster domain-containing protein [Planctomycetota bacterium]|nr:4Fe-4S dicluster domain-containing protein [Planctomycetota bacterium]